MKNYYLLLLQYDFLGRISSLFIGVFESEEDAENFYKDEHRFKKAAMDAVDEATKSDKDSDLLRMKEIINTGKLGLFEKLDVIVGPVTKY